VSIHKREGKRGTRWQVKWREGDQMRSETFDRKGDAIRRDAEIRITKQNGGRVAAIRGGVTLAEFVRDTWGPEYADPHLEDSTRETYRALWQTRIKPSLGDVPLVEITPGRIRAWQAEQVEAAKQVSRDKDAGILVGQAAIEKARGVLSSILTLAVEDDVIPLNPVRGVRKLSGPRDADGNLRERKAKVILDPSQAEALRGHLSDHDSALVAVLAYAGLRPGEAWRLRWSDVTGSHLRVWGRKTGGRHRMVPLRDPLAAMLELWKPSAGDDLVFRPIDHRSWRSKRFRPAVEAAGLPAGLRPYDLRHCCASLLIAEHRSIPECAEWMGHAPTMFLDTYAHVIASLQGEGRADGDDLIRSAWQDRAFPRSSRVPELGATPEASDRAASPAVSGDSE
jgi:integrase